MTWPSIIAVVLSFLNIAAPPAAPLTPALLSWHRQTVGSSTTEFLTLEPQQPNAAAPQRILNDSLGVSLTAQAALITDQKTGTVLWQKNPDERRVIASITKLMSAIVINENLNDFEEQIEISKDDFVSLGFNNFAIGETIVAKDLFAAVLIASDNTAVTALARATGLTPEVFIAEMNAKAKSYGLTHTKFADVTGLSNENTSTAREILVLAQKAFTVPRIAGLVDNRTYAFTSPAGRAVVIRTTNRLIGGMLTVEAGKTGFVSDAGYNIVARVTRDDAQPLLGVVLGSATNDDRFQDFKMLAHWAWTNFKWQ